MAQVGGSRAAPQGPSNQKLHVWIAVHDAADSVGLLAWVLLMYHGQTQREVIPAHGRTQIGFVPEGPLNFWCNDMRDQKGNLISSAPTAVVTITVLVPVLIV